MSGDGELTARVAAHYYRYAQAVDDGDVAAIDVLVADDVCVSRAADEFRGRDEVLALYRTHSQVHREPAFTQHVITNVQAGRDPDGTVLAQAYVTVSMIDAAGGVRLLLGRYRDRLTDVDGVLLLRHKRVDIRREVRLESIVTAFSGVAVPVDGSLD